MPALWFWLLVGMLAVYAVLDGFDLGAGALHLFLGRTADERATLLRTIGPVWDGNEVWLIAAGGTLFAAFPALYAVTFSGFCLPLMIVLWLLLLRAFGIEIRHQLDDPMWHQLWDVVFAIASALLAFVFGVALGNLVRGVPLDEHGEFFEPLWGSGAGGGAGVLDPYTALVGVTATVLLGLHGALWIALKTDGELARRAERAARLLFPPSLVLALATFAATLSVQPALRENLGARPVGLLLPIVGGGALVMARVRLGRRPLHAFVFSCAHLLCEIFGAAFAIFPHALLARDQARHLALDAVAANDATLTRMLAWWIPGMLLAIGYTWLAYTRMPATLRQDDEGH